MRQLFADWTPAVEGVPEVLKTQLAAMSLRGVYWESGL
jgi:hypothetical protein